MPNIHTPQRLPGESFETYRERRRESHRANHAATSAWLLAGELSSRQQLRAHQRKSGAMAKRVRYADAVTGMSAAKRAEALKTDKRILHDAHGAITLVGQRIELIDVPRDPGDSRFYELGGSTDGHRLVHRIWLAGISAQRGW